MQMTIHIAYIDPGAGAMVLQWLLAALLGGGIFFRRAISRMLGRLFGVKGKGKEQPKAEQGTTNDEDRKRETD